MSLAAKNAELKKSIRDGWEREKALQHIQDKAANHIDELKAENEALESRLRMAVETLLPFADFAHARDGVPPDMPITMGSGIAKRQLTMGDCYKARDAIKGTTR